MEHVPSPDNMAHLQLDARFFSSFFLFFQSSGKEVDLWEDKVQSVWQ